MLRIRRLNNNNDESSTLAIKVVIIICIVLIMMDILELEMCLGNLKIASQKFDLEIFEKCIKYHIICQMVFTLFALFTGISALMLSFCLLFESQFLISKMYRPFLHWNHLIFGPYLLTASVLGFVYFRETCFNCDPKDLSRQYVNLSSVMSLVICFVISAIISVIFSFCHAVRKIMLSIRFRPGGWKFLGRYFWSYVRSNNHDDNPRVNHAENQETRPNVRIQFVEIRNFHQDENDNHPVNVNDERRKKAEENIRKRIVDEERKDPNDRKIAFNEYTIKKLDDSGNLEDVELAEYNRSEEYTNHH